METNIVSQSLIPLIDKEFNGEIIKCVSARELYTFLGYNKGQWARWAKQNIIENQFVKENEDWLGFDIMSGGNQTKDFSLTLDFAKRISQMAKTEMGEKIRKYFIACEKQVKQNIKPMTQLEMMQVLLSQGIEQEKRQKELESRMDKLEAKSQITSDDYFTISGYCALKSLKGISLNTANILGRKCSKLSRELEYDIGKAHSQQYGVINTYHIDILEEVFKKY